jgi:choline-glycine betaine transporter
VLVVVPLCLLFLLILCYLFVLLDGGVSSSIERFFSAILLVFFFGYNGCETLLMCMMMCGMMCEWGEIDFVGDAQHGENYLLCVNFPHTLN